MIETLILTEDNLPNFAKLVAEKVLDLEKDTAGVILLEGDLGAGKTAFTKELAKHLGVTNKVQSPTFILKREYEVTHHKIKRIVHVDAYRFTHPREARVLKLENDLKDSSSLVVVEWPSKMNTLKSDIKIIFKVIDDNTREVSIEYEE